MGVQAALGLVLPGQYLDVEWIRLTWFGNDWVTLVVAAPALLVAGRFAARGSSRADVVRFGLLAYAFYSCAYYLFGAALNVFFPIYVAVCLLSAVTLGLSIAAVDRRRAAITAPRGLTRVTGLYFLAVGAGLASVWLVMWVDAVFAGHTPPIGTDAFKLVAALDLTIMVPTLILSGVLLWFRQPFGCWFAAAAGIQASMYLTVLCVNSALAVRGGQSDAAGELPVWGTLAVLTTAVATLLLRQIPATAPEARPGLITDRAGTSGLAPRRA
jgi:hypothetical protein